MDKSTRLADDVYDELKTFMFITFPFISSGSFCLSLIFENVRWVLGASTFFSLFLGICLTVSTKRYRSSGAAYDGRLLVDTSDDAIKRFTLEINDDPDDFTKKESITFKVVSSE